MTVNVARWQNNRKKAYNYTRTFNSTFLFKLRSLFNATLDMFGTRWELVLNHGERIWSFGWLND